MKTNLRNTNASAFGRAFQVRAIGLVAPEMPGGCNVNLSFFTRRDTEVLFNMSDEDFLSFAEKVKDLHKTVMTRNNRRTNVSGLTFEQAELHPKIQTNS